MRISRTQAQENRNKVLAAASRLFRTHGFDGVPVADIMEAAGLTHGGFYNHFSSKDELAREALSAAWEAMAQERARAKNLPQLLTAYLSSAARNAPWKACPAAALAGDVGRQPESVKGTFAHGLEGMIQSIAAGLPGSSKSRRRRAVALVTRMVGALILSRAVPDEHALAAELLDTNLRAALEESNDGDG